VSIYVPQVLEASYREVLGKLNEALVSLLNYIRIAYIEIDLEEYGNRALNAYIEEIKGDEE